MGAKEHVHKGNRNLEVSSCSEVGTGLRTERAVTRLLDGHLDRIPFCNLVT